MWLCDHIRSFHISLLIKPLSLLISLLTIFVLLIYLLISPNQMISSFFTPSQIPLALDHDRVSAHQWSCPRRIQHWQFQSSQDRKNDETWMKHGWTWMNMAWNILVVHFESNLKNHVKDRKLWSSLMWMPDTFCKCGPRNERLQSKSLLHSHPGNPYQDGNNLATNKFSKSFWRSTMACISFFHWPA